MSLHSLQTSIIVRGWSIVPAGLNCQIPTGLQRQSRQKQVDLLVLMNRARRLLQSLYYGTRLQIYQWCSEAVPNPDCYTWRHGNYQWTDRQGCSGKKNRWGDAAGKLG
ncbi:uncharacterized protein LOC119582128 isoform X2 [Penaeus monodon]|uniref:uncharacterized protein LOC119582128 isoform X2 n=1 Tax=Penaeus monodon TaxID=6687 RepID=UPI0018A6E106|nr:uncharacterized protein LOC119582128 isoform X2 [Penaeus monodon]